MRKLKARREWSCRDNSEVECLTVFKVCGFWGLIDPERETKRERQGEERREKERTRERTRQKETE